MTAGPRWTELKFKTSVMWRAASSISGASTPLPCAGSIVTPRLAQLSSRGEIQRISRPFQLGIPLQVPASAGDYIAPAQLFQGDFASQIVDVYRAVAMVRCPPGELRPIETAVCAQLSNAMLAQMINRSSQLALCIGDQIKSVTKAEQDCQQHPHLHPVQQQANRFETHLTLPGSLVLEKHSPR